MLTVVTVPGNALVLLAILLDPYKELKTPFNGFVANLALADLAVGLLADPLSVAFHVIESTQKPQPPYLQRALHLVFFTSCTASLLSLAALAVDRYFAVTQPLRYRASVSFGRVLMASLGIWIFSIALTTIYFAVGYDIYRFVFGNSAILATFIVMAFTYRRIFKTIKARVKQWDDQHERNEENLALKQALKHEKKVTKTLVFVLALFIACYLPSCICIYIINLCTMCGCLFMNWIRDIQFVLVLFNSAINPVIYGWRLRSFRHAFRDIMTCRVCCSRLRSLSLRTLSQSFDASATSSNANA